MFEIDQQATQGAKIKVIGVGGSGCNAVNTMIRTGLEGVEFITANTDKQALDASLAPTKLPIGQELTKGLGAGANPDVGRKAALEDYARISETLAGADMVFITAGMGGGTGTGAAPIFAKIAKEVGALTVGVVTKPFLFEGKKRMRHAEQGMFCLRESVDSLITIPNQRLLALSGTTLSIVEAFKKADEVLLNAVQGISDLINHTGLINSDFADVKTIMQNKGLALMGIGYGEGEHRAVEAATNAISSPLLEDISIDGATGIIINITGGSNLKIHEVNEATTLIMEAAHDDAEIIFGTVIDESIKDTVKVTVIATGLGGALSAAANASHTISSAVPSNYMAAGVTTGTMIETPRVEQKPTVASIISPPSMQTLVEETPQQPLHVHIPPAPQVHMNSQSHASAQQNLTPQTSVPLPTQIPPQPSPVMLANVVASSTSKVQSPTMTELNVSSAMDVEENNSKEVPPLVAGISAMSGPTLTTGSEGGELARARAIAQRLGITNLTDDEYDIPTYMRRQQEREV